MVCCCFFRNKYESVPRTEEEITEELLNKRMKAIRNAFQIDSSNNYSYLKLPRNFNTCHWPYNNQGDRIPIPLHPMLNEIHFTKVTEPVMISQLDNCPMLIVKVECLDQSNTFALLFFAETKDIMKNSKKFQGKKWLSYATVWWVEKDLYVRSVFHRYIPDNFYSCENTINLPELLKGKTVPINIALPRKGRSSLMRLVEK